MADETFEQFLEGQGVVEAIVAPEAPAADEAVVDETPAADEAVAETAAEARARDERGRFAAKTETDDDPVEARLKEKDRVIGSMAQEIGDLRKLVEERIPQQTEPQPQPQPRYEPDALNDYLDQNVTLLPQIAEAARLNNDQTLLRASLQKWAEYDQLGAMDYWAGVRAQQAAAQMRAELAQELQPALHVAAQSVDQQAVANVAADYPDFGQVIGALDEGAVRAIIESPRFPSELINRPDLASKEKVLEAIYTRAKLQYPAKLDEATQRAASEDAQASAAAKRQATVASATASSTESAGEGTGDIEPKVQELFDFMLQDSPMAIPHR